MRVRNRSYNKDEWGNWRIILDSANYTTYTVKKDGTGASGTWGISISGNAATASNASKVEGYNVGNSNGKVCLLTPFPGIATL